MDFSDKLAYQSDMTHLAELHDENTQLQTALTIKNGTIEQLKARVAELETLIAEVKDAYQNAIHWEDMRPTLKRIDSALFEKPSVLKDRNVTYSTSTQQAPARQVPAGWLNALDAAVSVIYFDDSSDFRSALWDVVRSLSAEIADKLEESPESAWHEVKNMLAAAPQAGQQQGWQCGCHGTEICGAFYDHNAQRMACRAMNDGACDGPTAAPQAEQASDYKNAARYRTLKHSLSGQHRCSHADMPRISAPLNPDVTYTPEGLDEALDRIQAEQFCDGHCTWLDHHPDCEIGKAGQAGGDS